MATIVTLRPSQDCLNLIKESEGLHRILPNGEIGAYKDPVRVWTIGYGSIHHIDKNRPVREGDVISKADAERWLNVEVDEKAKAVSSLCKVEITQGMFDALISFTFNFGAGALGRSTLLRKLNAEDYEGAAREFDRWIHGDGRVLPGLVIRRNKEEALFRKDGFPGDMLGITPPPVAASLKPYQPPTLPLQIQRTLMKGVTPSEDCYILNCGLAMLGFLQTGDQPNSFTPVTKDAVEWFQSRNTLTVDGKFGPETKAVLSAAIAKALKPLPDPMLGKPFCRLTRTGTFDSYGCEWLALNFVSPMGTVMDTIQVVSGAPGKQNFELLEDGIAGSLKPIPQSRYIIADIEWASGKKDDYGASFPHETNGIGPVFVPLLRTIPVRDREDRDSFGFHIDWNRSGSPGSAGCVCPTTLDALEKLVRLLRLYDPRDLFVDWGLL